MSLAFSILLTLTILQFLFRSNYGQGSLCIWDRLTLTRYVNGLYQETGFSEGGNPFWRRDITACQPEIASGVWYDTDSSGHLFLGTHTVFNSSSGIAYCQTATTDPTNCPGGFYFFDDSAQDPAVTFTFVDSQTGKCPVLDCNRISISLSPATGDQECAGDYIKTADNTYIADLSSPSTSNDTNYRYFYFDPFVYEWRCHSSVVNCKSKFFVSSRGDSRLWSDVGKKSTFQISNWGKANVNSYTATITCDPDWTEHPTSVPSLIPTNNPSSANPSTNPTSVPTSNPSSTPTQMPSSNPSSFPSDQPSSNPSLTPSGQPTGNPSSQPSNQPSQQPTEETPAPTKNPTRFGETYSPTMNPTEATESPTVVPSSSPTRPSISPTSQPSILPTQDSDCDGNCDGDGGNGDDDDQLKEDDSDSVNIGMIVGIILAVVVVLLITGFLLYYFLIYRKDKQELETHEKREIITATQESEQVQMVR